MILDHLRSERVGENHHSAVVMELITHRVAIGRCPPPHAPHDAASNSGRPNDTTPPLCHASRAPPSHGRTVHPCASRPPRPPYGQPSRRQAPGCTARPRLEQQWPSGSTMHTGPLSAHPEHAAARRQSRGAKCDGATRIVRSMRQNRAGVHPAPHPAGSANQALEGYPPTRLMARRSGLVRLAPLAASPSSPGERANRSFRSRVQL